MRIFPLILLLLPILAAADDMRFRPPNSTSVIEEGMCIPDITGQGFLHVDEDVANLVIEVIGGDGQIIALYDAATEIEDVAAPGTGAYSAPSTNNVRVSPSGGSIDCTEMQFSNSIYLLQDQVTITVSDGQSTIMDFQRHVYLNSGNVNSIDDNVIDADVIATGAIGAGEIGPDAIGASEIAANAIGASELASDAAAEVWGVTCEDQGGGYSCQEVMSLLLSEAMGTCVYTQNTRTWVCSDPSGTETRFTLVYGTQLDGDRSTSTPAPMTP